MTFALDGAGDLVGSADGFEVIRIHIVSAVPGPGAGEVIYTYSATLSQPLEHANAALENTDLLSGVTFQVTDKGAPPPPRAPSTSRSLTTFRRRMTTGRWRWRRTRR